MIDNEELSREILKYQESGLWSLELHALICEILDGISKKYSYLMEKEDLFQAGYVLCMGVCKVIDIKRNCFAYLNSCVKNMAINTFRRENYGRLDENRL